MEERGLVPRRPEGPLTQQGYEALRDHLAAQGSWRNVLLCKLLRATGLRISEVMEITPQHLGRDGPSSYVLVRRRKKRKLEWEEVDLPPQLALELQAYAAGLQIKAGDRLFPITDRAARDVFYKAGLAGIGRRVAPHEFRKLYVSYLLDGGVTPPATAKMVGHTDPRTTLEWYYELSREKRREIQSRMPV